MSEPTKRIPRQLAVIQVNNIVMYPYLMMPLVVSDSNLKKVIDFALNSEKLLGFFLAKDNENDTENSKDIYEYGTAVSILRMLRNNDGTISLLLQGISRLKVEKIIQEEPYLMVEAETIPETSDDSPKIDALKKVAIELLENIVEESNDLSKELIMGLRSVKQPSRVADIIAGNVNISVEKKQIILSTLDLQKRFELLNQYLSEMIKQMKIENRIRSNIQLEMDEDQRKYYLREQLDAIKKELGESDEVNQEYKKWEALINKADLPEQVEETAREELERLSVMSPSSSEYSVIRNYLEWIVNLPWNKYSEDRLDLKKIDQILTKDHYGLDKAKERIMEFIAVKKLKSSLKGPILCFAGPPGVGKTSLGRSIARAMKRKFIRISLGGIHDESEVRGHRRTYIGAMPGKIINEIKRAGTANPLFMLDEIDKIGKDFRGDPASALLEVLDPEQNNNFVDNYLNLPFDLSEVMFITTANDLGTIPGPLRDRMEIINFSSYIEEEKVQIGRKYLVPREMENNGLSGNEVRVMKSALEEIIRYYVREAGVRTLQRRIGTVMRKIARKVAEGSNEKITVTSKNVSDYLGRRKISHDLANRKPEVAVVTGLAWTSFGGEILFCEGTLLPGKGQLILTGLLGEVMKESARIAVSLVKSISEKHGINPEIFTKNDVHIHLPAGAVPKDGPSAGVTLTTCLLSLLTGKKVQHNIAMTGEITLRGKVLPVGGIREKILAAKRAGINTVVIPEENRDSFEEVKADVREGMTAIYAKTIEDVFETVLTD